MSDTPKTDAMEASTCESIDVTSQMCGSHWPETAKAFLEFARELERKIATLERWKTDALSVMPPLEDIAKELNVPLGVPIYDKILPGIRELKSLLATAIGKLDKMRRCVEIADAANDAQTDTEVALSASFSEAMAYDMLDNQEAEITALKAEIEELKRKP